MVGSEALGRMPSGEQVRAFTITTPRKHACAIMEYGAALPLAREVPDFWRNGTSFSACRPSRTFDNPACPRLSCGPP